MLSRTLLVSGALALGLVGGGAALIGSSDGYEVKLVLPSAAQLADGSPVWIDGAHAGDITDLTVRDGKAVVTVSLDHDYAPLHSGTTTRVEWNSAVGERMLTIYPGAPANAEIPQGSFVAAESRQIEVDQVLATLDPATRKQLDSLVRELHGTLDGREADVRDTIAGASSTVGALGEILSAVGKDGPAIRSLITQLRQMTDLAASRRSSVAGIVSHLDSATGRVAAQQRALSASLHELPGTLRTAQTTLDKVPTAAASTKDLLDDLRPAASRLPSVAGNLGPLLTDLRPTVAQLRPLLGSAYQLLGETPALLDTTSQVVPRTSSLISALAPALSFLRPYTPEGVGMLANWGQAFAPYDGSGHVWAGLLAPGTNSLDESVVQPIGSRRDPEPAPGQIVGQPWVDATGSGLR